MKTYRNVILIGGTARNVGKTSLSLSLIRHFSELGNDVVAVKATAHPHSQVNDLNLRLVLKTENYLIYEETSYNLPKDTSLMLKAGAKQAFYIKANDKFVFEAFNKLYQQKMNDKLLVCESTSLGAYIEAGVFVMLQSKLGGSIKQYAQTMNKKADVLATFDGRNFSFDYTKLCFDKKFKSFYNRKH